MLLTIPDSITFTCLFLGIMRAGCVVFPVSPRNSPVAVAHLLAKTETRHVFVSPDAANQSLITTASDSLAGSFKFNVHATPTFEDLFPGGAAGLQEHFEGPKRFAGDHAAIFHSSGKERTSSRSVTRLITLGTTSFPKPIYYTNRAFIDFGTMPRP